ncbi:CAP domain-containing protein, partial [Salinispora cortesiana]|uniref:CAP domain-containing protein n=1 Tax=Salinispora cortesiana TaxID=1305843 RepID=UPI0004714EDA
SRRQPEPAADEPAWPTDRPEPRSAYLFGDEPDSPSGGREQPADRWEQPTSQWDRPADRWGQPANEWDRPTDRWGQPANEWDRPTDRWGQPANEWDRPADRWDRPTDQWDRPANEWDQQQPTAHWQPDGEPARGWGAADHPRHGRAGDPHHEQPTQGWQAPPSWQHGEPTGQWPAPKSAGWYADEPTTSMPPVVDATPAGDLPAGEDRPGRRIRRPLLIGGAAAAATLVVSLGVGAVTLSGGGTARPTSAIDDIVATNPIEESTLPSATPTSASPSATPTTTSPTPSPSVTPSRKPSPTASRSTATSRPAPSRTTTPPTSNTTTTPANGDVSEDAAEVVRLANVEREAAGCAALSIDDKLMTAAQRHSQDQADNKKMSHDGSNGSSPGDRLDDVGYQWRTYGENVAWNQQSPAAVMKAWMNSPGHKANILNCSFTEIGVGIASSNGPYWTQVFAAPR